MKKYAGLIFLALCWLAFFSRTLWHHQLYVSDDLLMLLYPIEHIYAQAQQNMSLPVWANEFGFGQPLLAWNQLGFFTPLHVLLRLLFLHPYITLNLSILIHLGLAAGGMYLFLRRHLLSDTASALGAATFAFGGFMIGHLMHVNFLTATSLLPWLLVTIHWLIASPHRRPAASLGALVAATVVSAHPQASLHTILAAGLYGMILCLIIWRNLRPRPVKRLLTICALTAAAAALAFALSSLTLLPLLEFLPLSDRAGALPPEELLNFSYRPAHALTLIYPYFFGGFHDYWGAPNFQELAGYVGLIPLLLTGAALVSWQRHQTIKLTGLALIIIGATLALGKYSLVYRSLIDHRIITNINVPGRFIYWVDVGIALLAAAGWDDFWHLPGRRRTQALLASLAVAAIPLISLYAAAAQNSRAAQRLTEMISLSNITTALIVAGFSFWLLGFLFPNKITKTVLLVTAGLTLVWYGWNYNPLLPAEQILAAPPFSSALKKYHQETGLPPRLYIHKKLLRDEENRPEAVPTKPIGPHFTAKQTISRSQAADCLIVQMYAKPYTDSYLDVTLRDELSADPIETIRVTSQAVQDNQDQLICFKEDHQLSSESLVLTFSSPQASDINLYYSLAQTDTPDPPPLAIQPRPPAAAELQPLLLPPHLQAVAGASGVRWSSALSLKTYRTFVEEMLAADSDPVDGDGHHVLLSQRHLFDLAGVTHLTQLLPPGAIDQMSPAGFTVADEAKVRDYTVRLYRNPQAMPKAYLVGDIRWPASDQATLKAMARPNFDPRHTVLLSGSEQPPKLPLQEDLPDSSVQIKQYGPSRIDLQVATQTPAALVITDAITPQWQVYLDDQPAQEYRANTVFKGVLVPTGRHDVSWRYESPAIRRARVLTLLGTLVLGASLMPAPRFKGRPETQAPH